MNSIPGSDVLGFGFNILGEYSTSSITSKLFVHHNQDASEFTYPPTGISYQVPDNTAVVEYTHTTGGTQVFTTRQQFQNYFSTRAGVNASYGAFSGQFNMAYSQTFNTDKSYYYGLSESDYTAWQLILEDQSSSWLSPEFTDDPTVQNLPAEFTPENQADFFAMFRKFGTHFISKVIAGGSMDYFVAVEKSFSSSEYTVEADVSLEYKAVFYSAKAEAEAEWQQLGQTWAESRIVKVDASGGDTSVLNALSPGYGDSESDVFNSWSQSVMQNPAVVNFELRPLSVLFSGSRMEAVNQALEAYTNGALLGIARADYTPGHGPDGGDFTTSSSILMCGSVVRPNPPVNPPSPTVWHPSNGQDIVVPVSGFQIALFDPDTLEVIMSHIYYLDNESLECEQRIYPEMMRDIAGVSQDNYICTVTAFAVDLMNYPSEDFATWLASCGASLSGWRKYIGFTGSPGMVSYVCIGKRGLMPGNAVESFAMTTDWADSPWTVGNIDASAEVLLYANSHFIEQAAVAETAAVEVETVV